MLKQHCNRSDLFLCPAIIDGKFITEVLPSNKFEEKFVETLEELVSKKYGVS